MSHERRRPYPFDQIEPKWQAHWDAQQTFRALNPGEAGFDAARPKYYVLDMFPYPSGAGLHVGHPEGYTATDIVARARRMQGFNVLHPMGWDAFGLPAEQYAIKTGQHPAVTTAQNVAHFKAQLKRIGFSYDWTREINTTDADYFRWTQWIFLKLYNSYFDTETNKAMPIERLEDALSASPKHAASWSKWGFLWICHQVMAKERKVRSKEECEQEVSRFLDKHRLAFVSEAPVNWCPELGTVLANEEVVDGKSEVGGFPVERRPMRQWMLRITAFAQRLIDELDGLDWPDSIKLLQRNWIGRSEGAEVTFALEAEALARAKDRFGETPKPAGGTPTLPGADGITVFTTRPDTLFGATYMVLAPEHKLVDQIVTPEQAEAVRAYREKASRKSDMERTELAKEKTGVFTGAYAINPVNQARIPIWIADYVLTGYGTGAIMAVPAHDERDYDFARIFELPITQVVQPGGDEAWQGFTGAGLAVNSGFLDGLATVKAKAAMIAWLEERGLGKRTINFKLRDWLFSRQRYWGEPFPIVWENGQHRALTESELPLRPPELDDFKPTGTGEPPLAKAKTWLQYSEKATRETNTMPQWAGSCWYYLRYCDPGNAERFVSREAESYWMLGQLNGPLESLYQPTEWRKLATEMLERALQEKGKRPPSSLPFAKVSAQFAEQAEAASGEKLGSFVHAMDVYSIRHTWNRHGNPAYEAARGGEAVTMDDLLNLPRILAEPDSVEFAAPHPGGLKRFITKKRLNGTLTVVEEMRGRRGHLHLITFWKQKVATARDVTPKAPPSNTSETFRYGERVVASEPPRKGGVDLYVGGTEHAVLHLLYARFWHKVLFDLGYVSTPEPFQRLVNQGIILGEDGQKMSKSRGNVVNPDEVISEYGADSLRLYEMFMGPLEQMKPWSMNGVDGVSRFLARVWRLIMEEQQDGSWARSPLVQDVAPEKAQLKVIHATIKKVTADIEALSFNTAISQMMIFVNAFTNASVRPLAAMRTLLQLLNPFAPHLTEELWETLGFGGAALAYQAWPTFDEQYLVEDELEMPVQINGKLRDKVIVPKDASREAIEAAVMAAPRIIEHTAGREIKKVIVVPGKLVNIVIAG